MIRLFIENIKGYMYTYDNVYSVKIKKHNNKNTLLIYYNANEYDELIPLNEIQTAFLVNVDTMQEYFRYTKEEVWELPTKASISQTKYDKDHTVRYNLKLNKVTDKNIIDKIEKTSSKLGVSKQGAIKHLIDKSEV